MFLYLFPEEWGANSLCPGWVGSAAILQALVWTRLSHPESRCGKGLPTISCTVFITWAKSFLPCAGQLPYHYIAIRQRMLSMSFCKSLSEAEGGVQSFWASWERNVCVGPSSTGRLSVWTKWDQMESVCPGIWCCPPVLHPPREEAPYWLSKIEIIFGPLSKMAPQKTKKLFLLQKKNII